MRKNRSRARDKIAERPVYKGSQFRIKLGHAASRIENRYCDRRVASEMHKYIRGLRMRKNERGARGFP